MAEFSYKGRSPNGAPVSGRIEADSSDAVATRLFSTGITPLEIRAVAAGSVPLTVDDIWRRLGGGRPDLKDLIMFARQMHTITRSGLPLLRGLHSLMQSTHNPVLREALEDIIASLQSGRALAVGLGKHPDIFPSLFVNLVEVGEETGTLDNAFERLHEYLVLDREIRDRIKAATRYPMIVLAAIGIAIGVITVFVIPNFAPVFRALGDNIPLPTRIIMGVSDFTQNHGVLLVMMIGAAVAAFVAWKRTEDGRYRWDHILLRLPVVGPIVKDASLARITRSFAVALEAGLPINQTITTVARATGNQWLARRVQALREGIERGESFGSTAANAQLFTPLILQMIMIGEETGALPELLADAAGHYEREVDYQLDNLSAALEPLLIIAVGGCVLVLALGVFLPMWDMVSRAKGI